MSHHEDDFQLYQDLLIPVGDETVAATRYEPDGFDEALPALLMYIPYHKDDHITFGGYDPLIRYLTLAGYEVVVADMVGTGASSGCKDKPFSGVEGWEAAQIIEWLAEQDWNNGRIGMFGKSYGGITSLKAAAERPPSLEAIVPIHAPYDMYDWGAGARNFRGALGHWTSLMQALQAMPPTRRDPDGRWAEVWNERLEGLRDQTPWTFEFLSRETKDAYWDDMDIAIEEIDVPTFGISGWRDGFPMATEEYISAVDAPKRLLLGPWRHIMPHRGRESAINFREQVVEWFDRFLKDQTNGATEWPPIVYWTERAGGGRIGEGVWRGRERWPKVEEEGTPMETFAITPDGLQSGESFDGGELDVGYDYDHTVGIESIDYGEPLDTNADDARSLTYETAPLEEPFELTGNGDATIRVEATTVDPVLAVRVIDVSPDGAATLITHGQLRASHRDGHHAEERLDPAEEYEITIPLKAKSHVFEQGHRIRVGVSAALFPKMLPPRDQGSLNLRSAPDHPSIVRLPGRSRRDGFEFENRLEIPGPSTEVPATAPRVSDESTACRITREHFADAASVVTEASHDVDLPHADMSYLEHIDARVEASDPSSATVKRRSEISLDYGSETVLVEAYSSSSRDLAQATTRVLVDGEEYYSEDWTMRQSANE